MRGTKYIERFPAPNRADRGASQCIAGSVRALCSFPATTREKFPGQSHNFPRPADFHDQYTAKLQRKAATRENSVNPVTRAEEKTFGLSREKQFLLRRTNHDGFLASFQPNTRSFPRPALNNSRNFAASSIPIT
jgi:hypothetical protein